MITRYAASEDVAGATADATLEQGMAFAQDNGLLVGTDVTASSADYALTKLA